MLFWGPSTSKRFWTGPKRAGSTMIEKVFSEGNDTLYYIGDPDGNVVGFSEIGPMWMDRNE